MNNTNNADYELTLKSLLKLSAILLTGSAIFIALSLAVIWVSVYLVMPVVNALELSSTTAALAIVVFATAPLAFITVYAVAVFMVRLMAKNNLL